MTKPHSFEHLRDLLLTLFPHYANGIALGPHLVPVVNHVSELDGPPVIVINREGIWLSWKDWDERLKTRLYPAISAGRHVLIADIAPRSVYCDALLIASPGVADESPYLAPIGGVEFWKVSA